MAAVTKINHPLARSRRAAFPAVLLLCVLLTGCTGPEPQTSPTSRQDPSVTATDSTVPVNPQTAERQAVLDAYRTFWEDVAAAAETSDPAHPRLDDHATGEQLRQLKELLIARQREGIVVRGPLETQGQVTSLEGDQATVTDCIDATGWLEYDAETGEQQGENTPGGTSFEGTLSRDGGMWKVSRSTVEVGGC